MTSTTCVNLTPVLKSVLKCLGEEFSVANLGFVHTFPRLLLEPQCRGRSLAYVVYRVVVAVYFLTLIVYDGVTYRYGYKWFVYLTDWFYVVLTVHVLVLAFAVTFHYERQKRAREDDQVYWKWWPLKIIWCLQNMTLSGAILITVVYWGWALNEEVNPSIDLPNVTAHALIAIYALTDSFITGIPVRLLHVYQPPIIGLIYSIFTWLYWAAGGTNTKGQHFIYSMMDYSQRRGEAIGYTVVLILFSMLLHVVMFGVYKVRVLLYSLVCCSAVCCCCMMRTHDNVHAEEELEQIRVKPEDEEHEAEVVLVHERL